MTSWGIPLLYVLGTLAVGMAIPRLEHRLFPESVSTISAAAAMSICSAVASGMITLTGIVFSLAFVMVQFSATAYSPRLVRWLARDPVLSHALGIFTSTFLYALILLAWVDRGASGKVPFVSSWMVFLLLLASMGVFIALIERMGMLQVNRMLVFTAAQGRKAIDELYVQTEHAPAAPDLPEHHHLKITQVLTHRGRPQVVQALRIQPLLGLALQSDALIEVTSAVGNTILEKSPMLCVYGANQKLDERVLQSAVEIGDDRTIEQDPKYAIRLVVDIAIKALSPAINDPTTAVQALDQIEDLLLRLGQSRLEIGVYRDEQGKVRVLVPFPAWEDFLLLALDEIRFCGANSVQVMRRMMALIKNLAALLPAQRQTALRHWERRLQATIARSFADAEEQEEASVADRQGLGIGEKETNATSG